jgi:hypothetical protein
LTCYPSTGQLPAFVFNFAQTRQDQQAQTEDGARGNGELPVNDAQRYRMNATECLSAAERQDYRDLTLAIAASWLSLARHHESMDELLAILSETQAATAAPIRPAFPYHREPSRDRITAFQAREAISA